MVAKSRLSHNPLRDFSGVGDQWTVSWRKGDIQFDLSVATMLKLKFPMRVIFGDAAPLADVSIRSAPDTGQCPRWTTCIETMNRNAKN